MQDRITNLCKKLLKAEDSTDVHPTAEQLRSAISEKVKKIRAEAHDVALRLLRENRDTKSPDDPVTMEDYHDHRQREERFSETSLA